MKRPIFNKSGMKQVTDTKFVTFNKQNICVSTGNVISNCQVSRYLYEDMFNEKNIWFKRLNNADIKHFMSLADKVILYQFHVWYGDRRRLIAHIATSDEHEFLEERLYDVTEKTIDVVSWVKQFIVEGWEHIPRKEVL